MNQSGIFSSRPRLMRALLEAFIPSAGTLDDEALAHVLTRSDGLIADKPSAVRRQIILALNALRILALVRHLRGLTRLDPDKRRAFLESLQDSRVLKLRLAVWGLRTLLFAGYYSDPARQPDFGYRPHADGWSAWNEGAGHGAG